MDTFRAITHHITLDAIIILSKDIFFINIACISEQLIEPKLTYTFKIAAIVVTDIIISQFVFNNALLSAGKRPVGTIQSSN
jgi:hypothetical protein